MLLNYYIFAKNNIDTKTAFKVTRTSNYEANILATANKQINSDVFAFDTMDRIEERQPDVAKEVRIVWKSPADPLVWCKDVPADTKTKEFFVTYGKTGPNAAQEKAQLAKLQYSGFVESNEAQLNSIRQLELFKKKGKIESHTNLSADEKKAKLDDINRKMSDLVKS